MNGWLAALLSVGSLAVGSAMTMLGQSLGDQRTRRREREARREEFSVRNFDAQREALFNLQEMLVSFSEKLSLEKARRYKEHEYQYFDGTPLGKIIEEQSNLVGRLGRFQALIDGLPDAPLSKDEHGAFDIEIRDLLEHLFQHVDYVKGEFATQRRMFAKREVFQPVIVAFIQDATVCMYRTGSETVINATRDYINAVAAWNQELASGGADDATGVAYAATRRLHGAISEALKRGPLVD